MYVYIYIYIYIHTYSYTSINVSIYLSIYDRAKVSGMSSKILGPMRPIRPISVLRFWMLSSGILMSIGNLPESLSQRILVGIILVGRLANRASMIPRQQHLTHHQASCPSGHSPESSLHSPRAHRSGPNMCQGIQIQKRTPVTRHANNSSFNLTDLHTP